MDYDYELSCSCNPVRDGHYNYFLCLLFPFFFLFSTCAMLLNLFWWFEGFPAGRSGRALLGTSITKSAISVSYIWRKGVCFYLPYLQHISLLPISNNSFIAPVQLHSSASCERISPVSSPPLLPYSPSLRLWGNVSRNDLHFFISTLSLKFYRNWKSH